MRTIQRDFAQFILRDDRILVIRVDEGVEVGGEEVDEILDLITGEAGSARGLLIDRRNDYSLGAEAIPRLMQEFPHITAQAVLVYSERSEQVVQYLRTLEPAMRIFHEESAALEWLRAEISAAD